MSVTGRGFWGLLLASSCTAAMLGCSQDAADPPAEAGSSEPQAMPAQPAAPQFVRLPAGAPDFSGYWRGDIAQYLPPEEGAGPVQDIKGNPWPSIDEPYEADTSNPILLPWVRERLEQQNELETTGRHVPTPQETCSPYGVPWVYTLTANVQILQHPDVVAIVYQRGQQFRIVRMNQEHPEDPGQDWYGHSVGHYEGDTLVIDTVGFNDETWIDQFGTPHTEQLHVVERLRLVTGEDGADRLQIEFTVEDPGAFTTPWSAIVYYRRSDFPYMEEVCAEDNRDFIDVMTPAY